MPPDLRRVHGSERLRYDVSARIVIHTADTYLNSTELA